MPEYAHTSKILNMLWYRPSAMQLCLKKPPAQVFSCECCEIFKNSLFYRRSQVTASLLWTITILNYSQVLENLHIINDFNFTNFFSDRMMGYSTEGASYYCFRKAGSDNFFQKVLPINSTSFSISILLAFS